MFRTDIYFSVVRLAYSFISLRFMSLLCVAVQQHQPVNDENHRDCYLDTFSASSVY